MKNTNEESRPYIHEIHFMSDTNINYKFNVVDTVEGTSIVFALDPEASMSSISPKQRDI